MAYFRCIGNGSGRTPAEPIEISYLKWQITKTRSVPAANALQIAEFYLYLNNEKYSWSSNISITTDKAGESGQGIDKLIDENVSTKYCSTAWGSSQIGECNIIINLGETVSLNVVSSYSFVTAGDESSRDPISWKMYGSVDGTNWFELDSRSDASVPETRTAETTRFAFQDVKGFSIYTNGIYYPNTQQITDVSGFTKLYDDTTSADYGSRGTRVESALALTSESTIATNMNGGWSDSHACFYDSENKIGAYGGYNFGSAKFINSAKFWIGRFSGQNNILIATVEVLDSNGNWNEITDLEITTNLSYPVNVFEVLIAQEVYGIRWIHKKTPYKTSGNNICFFGMTLYEGIGDGVRVYTPSNSGYIAVPNGYDGFGPLLLR